MTRIVHIPLAAQTVMPWANGGGSTRQVAIDPPDGSLAGGFRWRVSIAQVEVDGPFSHVPGVDRSLWLLRGAGLRLDVASREVVLDHALQRFDFAGETPIFARLLDGPIEDLNVMVARDRVRATVDVLQIDQGPVDLALAAERLLVVLVGAVRTTCGVAARRGEALRVEANAPAALHGDPSASVLDLRLRPMP